MAKRQVTEIMYQKLLEAFREVPGNYTFAAAKAGVDPRTARRAWNLGWPDMSRAPIKAVLDAEKIALAEQLRAERQAAFESEQAKAKATRDKAQEDALRTKSEEAQMVRALRLVSRDSLQMIAAAFAGARPLYERVKKLMEDEGSRADLNIKDAVRLMRDMASIAKILAEPVAVAITQERVLIDNPSSNLPALGDVSPADAQEMLEDIQRTLKRAKKLGYVGRPGEDLDDEETPEVAPVPRQETGTPKVH